MRKNFILLVYFTLFLSPLLGTHSIDDVSLTNAEHQKVRKVLKLEYVQIEIMGRLLELERYAYYERFGEELFELNDVRYDHLNCLEDLKMEGDFAEHEDYFFNYLAHRLEYNEQRRWTLKLLKAYEKLTGYKFNRDLLVN